MVGIELLSFDVIQEERYGGARSNGYERPFDDSRLAHFPVRKADAKSIETRQRGHRSPVRRPAYIHIIIPYTIISCWYEKRELEMYIE